MSLALTDGWGTETTDIAFTGTTSQTTDFITSAPVYEWFEPRFYYPLIQQYYPVYVPYWQEPKIEKAFKIVQILLEKNIVKVESVKDFIELVNKISEVI